MHAVNCALACISMAAVCAPLALPDECATISLGTRDADGFLVHEVDSPFQACKTQIRVLLPDRLDQARLNPVIYVLPVEAGNQNRFGDGLLEVKNRDLANKHQAIFVAPTFSQLPWYADHPTDPTIRQERYFLKIVVPFIDKTYPVPDASDGRLLLGFSKSGWGAWALLLRHPDVFGRAAAWDGPMMMERAGQFGSGDIFGTQENFTKYQVSELVRKEVATLRAGKRLILMGYGGFPQEHQKMHALLDELQIPHTYRDGPQRKHDWNSGWVSEAAELLLEDAAKP